MISKFSRLSTLTGLGLVFLFGAGFLLMAGVGLGLFESTSTEYAPLSNDKDTVQLFKVMATQNYADAKFGLGLIGIITFVFGIGFIGFDVNKALRNPSRLQA